MNHGFLPVVPGFFRPTFPASKDSSSWVSLRARRRKRARGISQWQMAAHDFVNIAAKRERGRAPEVSLVFADRQAGTIRRDAASELMRRKQF